MQQQQPGTVTHSRINSLLISRHLTRTRVASRYSVRTSSYFKQLTSYLPVSSYVITCHECIHVTGSGRGNPNIFGCTLHASGWTPPPPLSKFLNPPLDCPETFEVETNWLSHSWTGVLGWEPNSYFIVSAILRFVNNTAISGGAIAFATICDANRKLPVWLPLPFLG